MYNLWSHNDIHGRWYIESVKVFLANTELNTSILTIDNQYYSCNINVTEEVTDLITVHVGAENRTGIWSKLTSSWEMRL